MTPDEQAKMVSKVVGTVADIIATRIIADGTVHVPGLGCFSVIHSGGKPYGVDFLACTTLNEAVKAKGASQ